MGVLSEAMYRLQTSEVQRLREKEEVLKFHGDFAAFISKNSTHIAEKLGLDRYQLSALQAHSAWAEGCFTRSEYTIRHTSFRNYLIGESHEYLRNYLLNPDDFSAEFNTEEIIFGATELIASVVLWNARHHHPTWSYVRSYQNATEEWYEMYGSGYVLLPKVPKDKSDLNYPGSGTQHLAKKRITVDFGKDGGFTAYGDNLFRRYAHVGEMRVGEQPYQVFGINVKPPYR